MKRTFTLLLLALLSSFVWAQNITISENFESGTNDQPIALQGWLNVPTQGTRVFLCKYYQTENNKYAQATAFGSTNTDNINVMWLITPRIRVNENSILRFRNKYGYYTHTADSVLVSVNFDGTQNGINSATWTSLNYTRPQQVAQGYSDWAQSGDISLSQWAGQSIYIAFKYYGSRPANKTTTWQVDDIQITNIVLGNLELSSKKVTLYPNPVSDYLIVNTFETGKVTIYNALGMKMLETTDLTIDVRNLQSGLYILQFENGFRKETIKFYKK